MIRRARATTPPPVCPMCGHVEAFDGDDCRGCLLKSHCDGDLCPRCGYERPRRGFVASLWRRLAPSLHRIPIQKAG